ncbi:MAG: hypothetical protein LH629_13540, partial [Ignavibacteria bacterium]|nr:hypothetical protein [Ignavibacteria bacterium]
MKNFLTFLILTFTALNSMVYSQSSWFWQQPIPTGNRLYATSFVNAQTGYSVGTLGTIIKTTNGGINWEQQTSNTNATFWGTSFKDANTGLISGDSGIIFRTSDGGSNWMRIISGVGVILLDIKYITNQICYSTGVGGVILKSSNAGLSWFLQNSGTSANLYSVSFLDTLNGLIGGRQSILRTKNAGLNWIIRIIGGAFDQVSTIQYIDSLNAYGLNDFTKFYKTTDGGLSWLASGFSSLQDDLTRSMVFKDVNTGIIATDFGKILKTTNGGADWNHDSTFRPNYYQIGIFW